MIQILWPTVRPLMMKSTHRQWIASSALPDQVQTRVAVNTEDQRKALLPEFTDVLVVGNDHRGVTRAAMALSRSVSGLSPKDVVVLASDDFFPPLRWDAWIEEQFFDFDGGIVVNDGYSQGEVMTIPILTMSCLDRLNKIIYHPSYQHQWSDAELYLNLKELRMLRDLRKDSPIFEHRHWVNRKRQQDQHDFLANAQASRDHANYNRRARLTLQERLTA